MRARGFDLLEERKCGARVAARLQGEGELVSGFDGFGVLCGGCAQGFDGGLVVAGGALGQAELDGVVGVVFDEGVCLGEFGYGVGGVVLLEQQRATMEVRGGERGVERDGALKLRVGLVVLLLLGEQGAECVVKLCVVGCAFERVRDDLLRFGGVRCCRERGGVGDDGFRRERLRGHALGFAEVFDGAGVLVKLRVRQCEVGGGVLVGGIEFVRDG